MSSLPFDPKLDVGHFLTSLTLMAGFAWWLYTTTKSWRDRSRDDARSGALRLILRILRDHGEPIAIDQLREKFHAPELRELRRAYCGRDYCFEDAPSFEAAVYRLDWEGKIDFPSSHEVVFRVDTHSQRPPTFSPTQMDAKHMLSVLQDAINDQHTSAYEVERIAEACMLTAPGETRQLLREHLQSPDPRIARKIAAALVRLLPQHA